MRKQCYAFICVVVTILLIGCYTASYDISQKQKDLTRIEELKKIFDKLALGML
jgi:hypothetical protein